MQTAKRHRLDMALPRVQTQIQRHLACLEADPADLGQTFARPGTGRLRPAGEGQSGAQRSRHRANHRLDLTGIAARTERARSHGHFRLDQGGSLEL